MTQEQQKQAEARKARSIAILEGEEAQGRRRRMGLYLGGQPVVGGGDGNQAEHRGLLFDLQEDILEDHCPSVRPGEPVVRHQLQYEHLPGVLSRLYLLRQPQLPPVPAHVG